MQARTLRTGQAGNGCICEPCPSFTECMRANDELAFCRYGGSPDCMFDKKGCLCPTCPAHPAGNPKVAYYCAAGGSSRNR